MRMTWRQRYSVLLSIAIGGLLPVLYLADSHFEAEAEAAAERLDLPLKDALAAQLQRYQDATQTVETLGVMDEITMTRRIGSETQAAIDTLRLFLSAESLFVMDEHGTQIAGSGAVSVGQNYSFRPYFKRAIAGSPYVYPGIGKNFPTPRLFFSAPHYSSNSHPPTGVVGLSVGIDKISRLLATPDAGTILGLITEDGIVFASSSPRLRYRTVLPISPARLARIADSKQFGNERIEPAGFLLEGRRIVIDKTRYLASRNRLNGTNVELFSLHPEPLRAYALFIGGVSFIYLLIVYLGFRLLLTLTQLKRQQKTLHEANASLLESQQALSHQATHDPLTNLLNRRGVIELLAKERARSERYDEKLALAMCDIDHFKSINDRWGHRVGDEVLCGFSRILEKSVREYDLVARIGGEEFLVVMPYKAAADSDAIFERFCRQIADSPIATQSGPLSVTISIGVAHAAPGSDFDELLDAADKALYRAKAQGRNRVVYAPDAPDVEDASIAAPTEAPRATPGNGAAAR